MKMLKKCMSTVVLVGFMILNSSHAIASGDGVSVTNLDVIDNKNITITLNNELGTDTLTNEDLKIMHDIPLETPELDMGDANVATVKLKSSLSENTSYNLISITGVDGSMDFETGTNLDEENIDNTADEGIQSITILNPKTIEVTYFDPISESEIELKLLRDLPIESIDPDSSVSFKVRTTEALKTNSEYIFMLLAGLTTEGDEAEIENGIFDFMTGAELKEMESTQIVESPEKTNLNAASEEQENTPTTTTPDTNTETTPETQAANETQTPVTTQTPLKTVELNSANNEAETDTSNTTKAGTTELKTVTLDDDQVTKAGTSIEEVASEVTEVPNTGTAANILIIFTLISTMFIAIRRKK